MVITGPPMAARAPVAKITRDTERHTYPVDGSQLQGETDLARNRCVPVAGELMSMLAVRPSILLGFFASAAVSMIGVTPAVTADREFPYDRELMLDVNPMKGADVGNRVERRSFD